MNNPDPLRLLRRIDSRLLDYAILEDSLSQAERLRRVSTVIHCLRLIGRIFAAELHVETKEDL